ncbi:DUF4177 domain-containing protein [Sporosarcina aquimarina]|uniref:DUF4177 domain-containing protein n=1 Tax=Sporosarcina aquimarina TaxID=114975 RepID=UPI00203E8AF3|nr:DUF4177 domain-containing protein [Sporosarcina aquimarina]MCM3758711.1 DUF4177 domain-containing protein [Sporosarcina aquimarina]
MVDYHIESIEVHHGREGISLAKDYGQLIAKYANEGWRFVQLVNFSGLSLSERRIDLIFEREKREGSGII